MDPDRIRVGAEGSRKGKGQRNLNRTEQEFYYKYLDSSGVQDLPCDDE
jgi:hypothetical protein